MNYWRWCVYFFTISNKWKKNLWILIVDSLGVVGDDEEPDGGESLRVEFNGTGMAGDLVTQLEHGQARGQQFLNAFFKSFLVLLVFSIFLCLFSIFLKSDFFFSQLNRPRHATTPVGWPMGRRRRVRFPFVFPCPFGQSPRRPPLRKCASTS